jgi:DNA-binding NarL/FixJ family response regulator
MSQRKRQCKHSNRATPREHEVLELLLAGFTNKAIAQQLGISNYTARDHVSALLKKNEVDTRAQLVARYVSSKTLKKMGYPLHLTDCVAETTAHNENT